MVECLRCKNYQKCVDYAFEGARAVQCYGFRHLKQVINDVKMIGEKTGADMDEMEAELVKRLNKESNMGDCKQCSEYMKCIERAKNGWSPVRCYSYKELRQRVEKAMDDIVRLVMKESDCISSKLREGMGNEN